MQLEAKVKSGGQECPPHTRKKGTTKAVPLHCLDFLRAFVSRW
jgi:hypothetical protein